MNSISHNIRYLPHDFKTKLNAVKTYRNGNSVKFVCRKYHISKASLMRWNKKYDGTDESLIDKSHRPHKRHPNAHSAEEIKWINDLIRRNPYITLNELWIKLINNKNYKRHPGSLYRVVKRLKNNNEVIKGTSKYNPKPYDTPTLLGVKWQIDVKYVPTICAANSLPNDCRFYQYTCLDEASRERFLYWYNEQSPFSTVDFIKRAIKYFGYIPKEIQTDNGQEFTWNTSKIKKIHPMDELCIKLNIEHHKIKPRTPRHNGKVERSHRNDNERFYTYLKFYSLEDLREQGKRYLKRSNNIPMKTLGFLSPIEMRNKLYKLSFC